MAAKKPDTPWDKIESEFKHHVAKNKGKIPRDLYTKLSEKYDVTRSSISYQAELHSWADAGTWGKKLTDGKITKAIELSLEADAEMLKMKGKWKDVVKDPAIRDRIIDNPDDKRRTQDFIEKITTILAAHEFGMSKRGQAGLALVKPDTLTHWLNTMPDFRMLYDLAGSNLEKDLLYKIRRSSDPNQAATLIRMIEHLRPVYADAEEKKQGITVVINVDRSGSQAIENQSENIIEVEDLTEIPDVSDGG